jgi:broad-specificity NMP kinase
MKQIKDYLEKNYSDEKIAELLDDEIINWVDPDWEDEYDSEYDWYVDHNNKEAEDSVIEGIIYSIKNDLNIEFDEQELIELIKEMYSDLV